MQKTKKRSKFIKPLKYIACCAMIFGVIVYNSVIPCYAISNELTFEDMRCYSVFPYDVTYYGEDTSFCLGCINYATNGLKDCIDDGLMSGRFIGGGIFTNQTYSDLNVGFFSQSTLYNESTVSIDSTIDDSVIQSLPLYIRYTSPKDFSYNATIDDYSTYGLNGAYIRTHYLIPNCLTTSDISAFCDYSFDLLSQSVSNGIIDGYESERVSGIVLSGDSSYPYVTVDIGSALSFDYDLSLYSELYDNSDLFNVLTVTVYPNGIYNEYNEIYGVYDDKQRGYSISNVHLAPSFELVGDGWNKIYDFIDTVWQYDEESANTIVYLTDLITNGECPVVGISFSYDSGFLSKSFENYAKFTGDYFITQQVVSMDTNLLDWLGDTLGGVLDVPLLGNNITLGTCLYVCVGLGIAIMILKFFAGG